MGQTVSHLSWLSLYCTYSTSWMKAVRESDLSRAAKSASKPMYITLRVRLKAPVLRSTTIYEALYHLITMPNLENRLENSPEHSTVQISDSDDTNIGDILGWRVKVDCLEGKGLSTLTPECPASVPNVKIHFGTSHVNL